MSDNSHSLLQSSAIFLPCLVCGRIQVCIDSAVSGGTILVGDKIQGRWLCDCLLFSTQVLVYCRTVHK